MDSASTGSPSPSWLANVKEFVRPYYLRWFFFPLFPRARPEYFSTCWQFPWRPLSSDVALPRRGSGAGFLFLPMVDWHARVQRTHHLARALVRRGHRCFWLNPHLGRQFPHATLREKGNRIAYLEPGIVELHVRLPREPVFHERLLTEAEIFVLLEALKTLMAAGGDREFFQIVSIPTWCDLACRLKEFTGSPVIYDCHDLLSGFRKVAREIVEREAELFRRSDLVIFSSQPLAEKKLAEFPWLREKAVLVRNAAETSHFEAATPAARA